MIGIVDYGVGNLFSLQASLHKVGVDFCMVQTLEEAEACQGLILPGVGAFATAMKSLQSKHLDVALIALANSGKPLLGICLGMQLLLETGYEHGEYSGLGLIPGVVRDLKEQITPGFKIPHMGWNQLQYTEIAANHPLFTGVPEGAWLYFVHSYAAVSPQEVQLATCNYGGRIVAAVTQKHIMGVQFHPEKSGETGLRMLYNYAKWAEDVQ